MYKLVAHITIKWDASYIVNRKYFQNQLAKEISLASNTL